jgi:hypothetical protein
MKHPEEQNGPHPVVVKKRKKHWRVAETTEKFTRQLKDMIRRPSTTMNNPPPILGWFSRLCGTARIDIYISLKFLILSDPDCIPQQNVQTNSHPLLATLFTIRTVHTVCVLHYLLLGDSLQSGDFSSFGIFLTCIPTQQPKQKEISLEHWYYCRAYF